MSSIFLKKEKMVHTIKHKKRANKALNDAVRALYVGCEYSPARLYANIWAF